MSPTPSARFSAEVRARLAFARMSPADLAPVAGVSEATIYRRLNEQGKWPLDEAISVCRFLKLPGSVLLQPDVEDVA